MGALDDIRKEQSGGPEAAGCGDDGRRFTLVVEEAHRAGDGQGVTVAGMVRGEIRTGDAVYIIQPGGHIAQGGVSGLERREEDGQAVSAESAEDVPVNLTLAGLGERAEPRKFSVLTNISPQPMVDVHTAVENPCVLGLSHEYARFRGDAEYLEIMIAEIVHAHYLVPVFVNQEPETDGAGRAVFTQGTSMSFPSLAHPAEEGKTLFPVFTDWEALSQWKGVYQEKRPPKAMIFRFQDVSTCSTHQNAGMVINPFSRNPVLLSERTLETIKQSEAYRRVCGEAAAGQVQEVRVSRDEEIRLSVPEETNEVRLLREAIAGYAEKKDEVETVYLLIKEENHGETAEKAYFCVVERPDEGAWESFNELFRALQPYANDIQTIEFIVRKKMDSVEPYLTEETQVYQKHG